MLLSCQQNAWQNHDIKKIVNRSFDNLAQFKYLRMAAQIKISFRKKLRGD
jgi:hypothetical protein